MNPYKLGVELYRNIEERWNKGQFGQEWEECDDLDVKKNWDLRLGLGTQKIFEVRALYNDVTFIDEFLTPGVRDASTRSSPSPGRTATSATRSRRASSRR